MKKPLPLYYVGEIPAESPASDSWGLPYIYVNANKIEAFESARRHKAMKIKSKVYRLKFVEVRQ